MPSYLFIEFITLLIGFISLRKLINPNKQYVDVLQFVVISFLIELIGTYVSKSYKISNGWIYNLYDIYKYSFIPYILLSIPPAKFKNKWPLSLVALLCAISADAFLLNSINDLLGLTSTIGTLIIIVTCLIYFRQILKTPNAEYISKVPEFWLFTGVFLYFLCMLPYQFLWNLITNKELVDIASYLYVIISTLAIAFLYISISIYFILCRYQKVN
jgi:hypothetical protein